MGRMGSWLPNPPWKLENGYILFRTCLHPFIRPPHILLASIHKGLENTQKVWIFEGGGLQHGNMLVTCAVPEIARHSECCLLFVVILDFALICTEEREQPCS